MLKHLSLVGAALTMGAAAIVPTAPAMAQRHYHHYDHRDYRPTYRGRDRYYQRDYRSYRRCRDNGTGGTIIGAIAGGLLGRTIDTHGDRTTGTVLGAGAGALAGRAIDRSDRPGYCR